MPRNIEDSGKRRGMSGQRATQMAYASMNKPDKGGKKSSGRGRARGSMSARRGRKTSRYTKR
jgi:hypothetical protein